MTTCIRIAIAATFTCFVAAFFPSLLLEPGRAQVLYGSIVGTVTDATGANVPHATVMVTHLGSGQTRQASADEAGRFVISDAASGSYELKVSASGFRTFLKKDIPVAVNTVSRVDVTLEVGALNEQVTVAAVAATIQTDNADVHVTLGESAVVNLPLPNYRNYQSLIDLVPGATPSAFQNSIIDTPGRALTTNINGTNRNSNDTRIDGALSVNIFLPHHTLIVPPVESIETVNISTDNFDAEQGMAGGAAITVITKSGTNQFHGSAFAFHNDQDILARDFFAASKPKSIMNIDGGTFGGPIRRNKLFFFSSWEGMFQRLGWSSLFTVPTADQRNGDFSAYGATIYDPATGNANGSGRTAIPGGVIPMSRQSSITRTVESWIPLPNQPGAVSNYFNSGDLALSRNNVDVKVDWHRTDNHTIWGKYSVMDALAGAKPALGAAGGSGPYDAATGHTRDQMGTIGHTWTITPRLVLDGTFGFGRLGQYSVPTIYYGQNVGSSQLGIPGTNGSSIRYSGLPTMSITGYATLGSPDWEPEYRNDISWTHSTNMGWVHGPHEFRWGFDLVRHNMNHWEPPSAPGLRGLFNFDGAITGLSGGASPNQYNAYAAFLLGLPQSSEKTVEDIEETGREWQFAWYFRDRWQATRKLTLTLGVRYELYPFLSRRGTGIEGYNPQTNQVLLGGRGGIPDDLGVTTSHKLFAPRFGLAYRLKENTVIRGGYGITYDPMPLSRPFFPWYPILINNTFVGANSYTPFQPLAQGIPLFGTPDLSSGYVNLPPAATMLSPWRDAEFHRGYIQSWNLIVERRLPASLVATVGYVGTQSVHLLGYDNINAAAPGTGTAGRPLYGPFGRTASTYMMDGWLSSHYNALQVTVNRSFTKGLLVKAAYTFSKAIDMADDDGRQGLTWNWGPVIYRNRALAGFDRTHMLQLSSVYELPFGRGKQYATTGLLSVLAGGWQTNGIFSAYSGAPFSVTASGASLNAPDNSQTADQVLPNVQYLGGIGPNTPYYNPLAFRAVTAARFGSSGRDILRGPGEVNLNASVFRTFRLRERIKLEFRAEAYNLSNTPHFNAPSANVSSMSLRPDGSIASLGNFMSITSTVGDPRQFRFGLRLSF